MTRRRFYAPPEAFDRDRTSVALSKDETQHLRNVLRLKPGGEVYVFDGEGREFRGEINSVAHDATTIQVIQEVAPSASESPLKLSIAIALLKGEKFDFVIQKLTELGVNAVVPLIAERADVRLRTDADATRKVERWRRIALEAAKQCGRARLMTIEQPLSFEEFTKRDRADEGETRLLFAERDGESFDSVLNSAQSSSRITAIVGSEGGWANDEISDARQAGWQIVTLGGRIMRAETAAIAVATLLQHRFGDLK